MAAISSTRNSRHIFQWPPTLARPWINGRLRCIYMDGMTKWSNERHSNSYWTRRRISRLPSKEVLTLTFEPKDLTTSLTWRTSVAVTPPTTKTIKMGLSSGRGLRAAPNSLKRLVEIIANGRTVLSETETDLTRTQTWASFPSRRTRIWHRRGRSSSMQKHPPLSAARQACASPAEYPNLNRTRIWKARRNKDV